MSYLYDSHANFIATAVISASPSLASYPATSSIVVASAANFPNPATSPYNCIVYVSGQFPTYLTAELVRVTAISGNTLTVTRGVEGSQPISIVATNIIALTVTAKCLSDIETATNTNATSIATNTTQIGVVNAAISTLNGVVAGIPTYGDITNNLGSRKVGIVNTSPAYTLDVYGNINFTGNLTQGGVAYGAGATMTDITDNTSLHRVGVNISSPQYTLDLGGTSPSLGTSSTTAGLIIETISSSSSTPYDINVTAGNCTAVTSVGSGANVNIIAGSSLYSLSPYHGGNINILGGEAATSIAGIGGDILLIPGTGQTPGMVGVNTTTPAYTLDVNGAIGNSDGNLNIYAGFTEEISNGNINLTTYNGNLTFVTYGVEGGNFGVGTTSPAYTLDVWGAIGNSDGNLMFGGGLSFRYNDGYGPQLYNTTTGKWHTLLCVNNPPQLAFDAGMA